MSVTGAVPRGGFVAVTTGVTPGFVAPGVPVLILTPGSVRPEPGDRTVALPAALAPLSTGALSRPGLSVRLERPTPVRAPRLRRAQLPATVQACGATITKAARSKGAVRVAVAQAGPSRGGKQNAVVAPLSVEVVYARQGKTQVRQARVACHLNARGQVVALL